MNAVLSEKLLILVTTVSVCVCVCRVSLTRKSSWTRNGYISFDQLQHSHPMKPWSHSQFILKDLVITGEEKYSIDLFSAKLLFVASQIHSFQQIQNLHVTKMQIKVTLSIVNLPWLPDLEAPSFNQHALEHFRTGTGLVQVSPSLPHPASLPWEGP